MPVSTERQQAAVEAEPVGGRQEVLSCRTCGAENVPLHFDSVAPPERVSDLVVRDRGRCISCVVQGR